MARRRGACSGLQDETVIDMKPHGSQLGVVGKSGGL